MTAHRASSERGLTAARSASTSAWLPLAAIVLLGALLRFATLAVQSLWFDEAATWELTQLPFVEMLRALPSRESNPPLFYVLEWVATRALGDGEVGLRALSALAGTALIAVAGLVGQRIAGARAGVATAALVAVNPLLVWFSQEARSYALVTLLATVALLLFLRALDDPRPSVLAWWAVAAALALSSHYFAAFALAPQAAWLLWRHPRRPAVAAAIAAQAVVSGALLPLLLAQHDNPYDIAAESLAVRAVQVPKQFLLGYRGPLALPIGLLAAVLIAFAVVLLLRRAERTARERAVLVGAVGATALLLPLLAAAAGADYVNARNLLPALPPLLVVIATGFAAVRGVATAALCALCALSLAIVVATAADRGYQRADWKGLAAALGEGDGPRALVISPANGAAVLRYYLGDLPTLTDAGAEVREIDVVAVAGSPRPGEAPVLPAPTAPAYSGGVYGTPTERTSGSWVILRFRPAEPQRVQPLPLTAVRFSLELPSVLLQPAGR